MSWVILCETSDIAAQGESIAESIGLSVQTRVESQLCEAAVRALGAGERVAVAFLREPKLDELVELAHAARERSAVLAVALVGWTAQQRVLLEVAGELGLCAVHELRPLCAALQLLPLDSQQVLSATGSRLAAADRVRLQPLN